MSQRHLVGQVGARVPIVDDVYAAAVELQGWDVLKLFVQQGALVRCQRPHLRMQHQWAPALALACDACRHVLDHTAGPGWTAEGYTHSGCMQGQAWGALLQSAEAGLALSVRMDGRGTQASGLDSSMVGGGTSMLCWLRWTGPTSSPCTSPAGSSCSAGPHSWR